MIVDMRVYTYAPAQFAGFVKAYAELGHAIVSRRLGQVIGVFISASGIANRTLQLFAYADHDHRDACRQALRADPAWLGFIRGAAPAIMLQENTILHPAALSPASDLDGFKALAATTTAADRLFELRTRTFHPGQMAQIPAESEAAEMRLRIAAGENVLAQFATDTGSSDRMLSLSAYRSAGERDKINKALYAVPDMATALAAMHPALASEVRELWLPLPCSPLR